jgi:cytochrome o ubiquinol oxidase subunit 3
MTTEQLTDQNQSDRTTVIGFWIYIMTDCVLFASLFATYSVLHNNLNGGDGGQQLFNLSGVLAETLILLCSSFACGLALLAAKAGDRRSVMVWLAITALLGLAFLGIEISEFHHLAAEGNSWRRSGFLSAFFTLVGTHGLHITAGLLWLVTLAWRIKQAGLDRVSLRRLTLFSMFWHFLDLVWIFIFTVVYLTGGLGV